MMTTILSASDYRRAGRELLIHRKVMLEQCNEAIRFVVQATFCRFRVRVRGLSFICPLDVAHGCTNGVVHQLKMLIST